MGTCNRDRIASLRSNRFHGIHGDPQESYTNAYITNGHSSQDDISFL